MKVRRVWECTCGATKLFMPAADETKLIVKGSASRVGGHDDRQLILCTTCNETHEIIPTIIVSVKPKLVWSCEHSNLVKTSRGDLIIGGEGIKYGSPITHVRCRVCGATERIAPDVVWYDHLQLKKKKREGNKANRDAKRRRRRAV